MSFLTFNTTSSLLNLEDKMINSLRSFIELHDGWDCGEGNKIDENVIRKSIELYKNIKQNIDDLIKVSTNPNSDGGITLTFSKEDNFIDILIRPDLKFDLRQEKGIGINYDIVDEIENIDYYQIINKLCNLSEQFQLKNSNQRKEDFRQTSLKTIEEVFQYLNSNALYGQAKTPFVTTLPRSTPQYRPTQVYTA